MSRLPFQFIEFDLGHEASLNINTHKHIYPYSHWWHQILESKIEPFREAIDRKKRGGEEDVLSLCFTKEYKENQNSTIRLVKLLSVLLLTNKSNYHPKRTYKATKAKHPGLELDVASSTTCRVALSSYPPSSLCSLNHLCSCNPT